MEVNGEVERFFTLDDDDEAVAASDVQAWARWYETAEPTGSGLDLRLGDGRVLPSDAEAARRHPYTHHLWKPPAAWLAPEGDAEERA